MAFHRLCGADAIFAAVAADYGYALISLDNEHFTRLAGAVEVRTPAVALAELSTGSP